MPVLPHPPRSPLHSAGSAQPSFHSDVDEYDRALAGRARTTGQGVLYVQAVVLAHPAPGRVRRTGPVDSTTSRRADAQRGPRHAAVRDDDRDDGALGERQPGPHADEGAGVVGVRCGAGAFGLVSQRRRRCAGRADGARAAWPMADRQHVRLDHTVVRGRQWDVPAVSQSDV